jgi:hypothetical protein
LRQRAVLQEKSELVAAQPSHHRLVQECRAGAGADRLVSGLMAVRVIDLLKIIDVEDDRREAPVRLGGAGAGFARLL